jgi:ribosomal protein L7/L12
METSFYSWIRKGLGSQINEIDNLGETSDKTEIIDNEAKKRATVQLTTVVKARLLESGETSSNSESDSSDSEKSEMDFILNGIDESNKKDVLNAISSFAKVNLTKANEIVDSPNSFFRKTVSKTEAETFKNNLNKLGAKVVLVNVVTRTESKTIALSGPSDVISLDSKAIARVFPTPDFDAFPKDEYPYVEFWEPDFAWRFTPAKAAENGKKLRPWLALVVCESSKCSIEKTSWGTELVTFNVESDVEYKNVFPNPADVWCMAHAQSKKGEDAEFCRILGVKSNAMERNAEYRAFLIPVFEVGRLRGLRGPNYDENADQTERSLNNIAVQTSAWEISLDEQKKKHESPLTFPSYYSWNFRTGDLSFVEKVRSLVCNDAKKSGIDVDVTSLGEGLDYAVLAKKPTRNKINMPAALTTVKSAAESAFPNSSSDEKDVYDHLNS